MYQGGAHGETGKPNEGSFIVEDVVSLDDVPEEDVTAPFNGNSFKKGGPENPTNGDMRCFYDGAQTSLLKNAPAHPSVMSVAKVVIRNTLVGSHRQSGGTGHFLNVALGILMVQVAKLLSSPPTILICCVGSHAPKKYLPPSSYMVTESVSI